MMLEITRNNTHIYKIEASDPYTILYKENKHRAKWKEFGTYASQTAAKRRLLAIGRDADPDGLFAEHEPVDPADMPGGEL